MMANSPLIDFDKHRLRKILHNHILNAMGEADKAGLIKLNIFNVLVIGNSLTQESLGQLERCRVNVLNKAREDR